MNHNLKNMKINDNDEKKKIISPNASNKSSSKKIRVNTSSGKGKKQKKTKKLSQFFID